MRKPVLLIILTTILLRASPQTSTHLSSPKLYQPQENSRYFKLGERLVQVKMYQYGNSKEKVYVNLHDDEITAVNGVRKLLEKKGGYLIRIENYKTRNLRFKLNGTYYTIDPNRMFSREGIMRSLIIFGNTSPEAIEAIERFANHILELIPRNAAWIIALHNNTNGKYSINSYLPGGEKEKDAKELNVNGEQDADDFFFTTDSTLFYRLANERYNTILQDNEKAKRDGSLSIYCGERNMHYVNCETEHGRQTEYDAMIVSAVNEIELKGNDLGFVKSPDKIVYAYRIVPAGKGGRQPVLKNNSDILFGEAKVGVLRSIFTDSTGNITGKLELNKDFPLSSDMDFYLFIPPTDAPRLEVRIDPTRKKTLLQALSVTVSIVTKIIN